MPDWVHQDWKDYDKREVLRLSLIEALKACGTSTDAETRKRVKAWSWLQLWSCMGSQITMLELYPFQAKFIQRVTIRTKEKEKKIVGLWCTEERMKTELKYGKQLSGLISIHLL